MPTTITEYTLLISCPSDVLPFIKDIEEAVSSFNNGFGNQFGFSIRTLHYSKNTYSKMQKGSSAQKEVNKQIVMDSDMLVGVFWTRFGSPTEEYGSGSEEEITLMMNEEKHVILYFLDKPIAPSKIDPEQLKKVNDFKKAHQNEGLYFTLYDEKDLALKLRNQLEFIFRDIMKNNSKENDYNMKNIKKYRNTILWVDNHPENNALGYKYFEANNIEIVTAMTTDQALKWLDNNNVDIIISDLGRKEGKEEGFVLLDRLRNMGNNTPFIVFLDTYRPELATETKAHGGQGCTDDFEQLFDMVRNILLES